MLINLEPLHEYLNRAASKGATDVSFEPGGRPKVRVGGSLREDDQPVIEQYELDAIILISEGMDAGMEKLRRLKEEASTETFTLDSPSIGPLRCSAAGLPSVDQGFMVVVRLTPIEVRFSQQEIEDHLESFGSITGRSEVLKALKATPINKQHPDNNDS